MPSPGLVGRSEGLVSRGPTGRGRTHVATAPGVEATRRGVPVRLCQAALFALRLGKARREGTPDGLMADIGRASPAMLGEFGHVPFDVDGARPPRQVMSDPYERGARRSPPTSSPAGGARSSRTTGSPRRSSTASRAAAGSRGSAARATGSRSRSCWGGPGADRARDETRKSCVRKPERNACSFGTAVGILDQIHPMRLAPNPFGTAWGSCNPGRS